MSGLDVFHFDGGCRPNPGPMEAAVVHRGRVWFFDNLGAGDNNQAEWLALIQAARLAAELGVRDPVFVGDSALVVAQAAGRQRCRSAQLAPYPPLFREVAAGLGRIRLRHVRRSRNLAGIALARRGLP